jgi:phosphate acetyltransferase
VVTGARETAGSSLRPLLQLIKPLPEVKSVSSCMMLDLSNKRYGEKGTMFFADCGVIPEPTVEQLADIAVQTGVTCRQLTGIKPRIAMLSFSTKGSSRLPQPEKIAAATALARQKIEAARLEMEIDGELQADAAILPELGKTKAPSSLVAGQANVLVFPDLNAGNIAVKLVQYLAGAETYGQILLGLSKPCADLSRGASEDDILGVAAIMCLQAIEYRHLYPPAAAE